MSDLRTEREFKVGDVILAVRGDSINWVRNIPLRITEITSRDDGAHVESLDGSDCTKDGFLPGVWLEDCEHHFLYLVKEAIKRAKV